MLNKKVLILLGAVLLVNLAIVSARRHTPRKNRIAISLGRLIDQYDQRTQCWVEKYPNVLLKEKIFALEAILEMFSQATKVNNNLAEDDCKTDVKLSPCEETDYDAKSKCLLSSIRTLIKNYDEQEKCSASPFKTTEMRITNRFMKANLAGWKGIHPDC